MNISTRVELNNGVQIPWLGLGVFAAGEGSSTVNAVRWAIDAGYRLIDTAAIYLNERETGQGVRECGVPREEIFVTTKVWHTEHGREKTLRAFDASMEQLDIDYIDLYLIHWPGGNLWKETWKTMEEIYREGRIKAIGVSNFTIAHLDELLLDADVVPAVNQVEFHPYNFLEELRDYCHSRDIRLEAYTPLTRGRKLSEPALVEIASGYNKSPAQILIRWCLQHGVIPIPKSSNQERIRENADVFDFEISPEDIKKLNELNRNQLFANAPADGEDN